MEQVHRDLKARTTIPFQVCSGVVRREGEEGHNLLSVAPVIGGDPVSSDIPQLLDLSLVHAGTKKKLGLVGEGRG